MTRSIPVIIHSAILFLFLAAAGSPSLHAQLEASFEDVDYSQLPRVTFKACVRENGLIVRGLDPSQLTLLENGVPQQLSIRCPDATETNSVVLVLDNSGSMSGAMSKLIEASKRLVDSLGANDECAVITFGRGISVAQDFTTDKAQLKTVLDAMQANGGTPLFDASYEGCGLLQARSGNRHAVIITDGEDNTSTHTVDDVIAVANMVGARLHTIAFDIGEQYQGVMRRMAVETGGVYFFVSRPSELTAVYEKIADIITEPCCIAEFVSPNCVDTLRSLLMTVTHGGQTAVAAQDFISPFRPAQHDLIVEVPFDMTPLATDRGYIHMIPPPSMDLDLTLSFVLEYDQNLVDISVFPFLLGTVAQNQTVNMLRVGPGALRFEFNGIRPALSTTRLIGFPVQALMADSSRHAQFTIRIRDIQLEGCPTQFTVTGDSTLICQCYRALDLESDSLLVLTAQEPVLIPLRVRSGVETGIAMQVDLRLSMPEEIGDVDVLPGTLLPEGSLQWERDGDIFRLHTPLSTYPVDTSGVLATLRFGPNRSPDYRLFTVRLLDSELWQRCCPEAGPTPIIEVRQEGVCEFFVRGRTATPTIANAPNPFSLSSGGVTTVILDLPGGSDGAPVVLDILDGSGRLLRRLYEGELRPGGLRLPFDATGLPSGSYHAVLRSGGQVVTRAMLYLR